MKTPNTLLSATGTTIFTVMSALAEQHGAINLGQGFPDTDGPPDVIEAAAAALHDGRNQYPPLTGVPELRAGRRRRQPAVLRPGGRPAARGRRHLRRHRGDHRLA